MSENYAQQFQSFVLYIVYEFFRLVTRIYNVAAAFASVAYYVSVAFQAAAHISFYFHLVSPSISSFYNIL